MLQYKKLTSQLLAVVVNFSIGLVALCLGANSISLLFRGRDGFAQSNWNTAILWLFIGSLAYLLRRTMKLYLDKQQ